MTLSDLRQIRETGMKPELPIIICLTNDPPASVNEIITDLNGNLAAIAGLDIILLINNENSPNYVVNVVERLIFYNPHQLDIIRPDDKLWYQVVIFHKIKIKNQSAWFDFYQLRGLKK